jgi:hypothetical protein
MKRPRLKRKSTTYTVITWELEWDEVTTTDDGRRTTEKLSEGKFGDSLQSGAGEMKADSGADTAQASDETVE